MTNDKPRKTELLTPLREGEFRRINGIAENTEARLHAAGILTFDQLSTLSPEEIAAALPGQVGVKERAAKQDWAAQASQFAQTLLNAEKPQEPDEAADRQHYESFIVELLMDEEHHARRTRVTAVRGGEKTGWTGWEPQRLEQWIAAKVGLQDEQAAEEAERAPEAAEQHRGRPTRIPRAAGSFNLGEMSLYELTTQHTRQFFPAPGRFEVRVPLDLKDVEAPAGMPLTYQVTVDAHRLGDQRHITLGEASGECLPGDQLDLRIPVSGLGEGTYRLELAAVVYPTGAEQIDRAGLKAFAEGMLVQLNANQFEPA